MLPAILHAPWLRLRGQLLLSSAHLMRVLILNQTFYPDLASTGQLMWELARHLRDRGHEVHVLSSRQFYGTTQRHPSRHQRLEKIDITRVGGTALGKKNLWTRLLDFASFYVSAGWELTHQRCPDVILALTSPPMIAALAGMDKRRRQLRGEKTPRLVYHVMDLYPDAAIESGVLPARGPATRLLEAITRMTLRRSDAIIALGRDMAERLTQHYGGRNPLPISIVTPWADGRLLFPLAPRDNPLLQALDFGGKFVICYSGNLGLAHDLQTISEAMELSRDRADWLWLFVGGGVRLEQLRRHAESRQWTHTRFLPLAPKEQLNESLNLADVHLVSQLPQFSGVVVPSKLFGILAVARPTIMIGPPDAECSRIVSESQCGVVVANGHAAELVRTISRLQADPALRQRMGQAARRVFQECYDLPVACGRIESILAPNQ